ncbi:MAG: SDR family NAD(P)-dependent oxidoreductase [Nodularia sp. CChRGM 3473]
MKSQQNGLEVAVIGLAGRFPGSKNIESFWQNLSQGLEFASVLDVESSAANQTIKAAALLENIEQFDAAFFGFNPREAEIMDPQHRLFLECAWEALENAGYDSEREERLIGVYAGVGTSTYLLYNLFPNKLKESMGYFPILLASDKDYVPTRVSYKLNLKGPSVCIGTACSSSLVAAHFAYQSLLNGECDMALAAGVSIKAPQTVDTLCPEGIAADGHCRAFDAQAQGTIGGNGIGVVVLKRLADAIADQDYIYAVIKGSAINNDGSVKVSYTAPSQDAQARVIRAAQIMAEVEPETITYIETHGTGTPMGDPIEIAALTQAFATDQKGYCAIGSVKTNIGHLDAAAGIAGLIKTILALDHQTIPPSLNFTIPNPQIDFANSPFYVNHQLAEWKTNSLPRRAGVSSFGFGGTNAHIILEEAPPVATSAPSRPWQLLSISTKTNSALETTIANLVQHLQQHSQLNLADVAYTLQIGRREFDHRQIVVCRDVEDAIVALADTKRVLTSIATKNHPSVAFMFTGLGTQYVDMGWELYQTEPTFRDRLDYCCQYLQPLLNLDLRDLLYPHRQQKSTNSSKSQPPSGLNLRQMLGREAEPDNATTQQLNQTCYTQPAMFVIEYALAQLWMSWGIRPVSMIGYSIGEYVAATLAGVLSLEDALTLVAQRAQMIQTLPEGAMLAVPLSEIEVRPLLKEKLTLSAINGLKLCVIAGDTEAVAELTSHLTDKGVVCRCLQTSHAFHSQMMQPISSNLTELVKTIKFQPPQIPYISNVTGNWITAAQATDPNYWTQHLCQPVRFADGIKELWKKHTPIFLEVGVGQTLTSLTLQCLENEQVTDQVVLPSVRHSYEQQSDVAFLLNTLGQLWLSGVEINWQKFYAHESRHRVPLPTYPFERQRYWVEPPHTTGTSDLWVKIISAAQRQAVEGIAGLDSQVYQEQRLWLERLCTAYMNQTLRQLGAFSQASVTYSVEELCQECKIIPRYRELLARWLNVLVEQKQLQQDQAGRFHELLPLSASVADLIREVRLRSADILDWIDIYQTYGENLPAILIGEKEPLEFHFSMKLQEQDAAVPNYPTQHYYKPILRAIAQQLVESLPPHTPLRILELGAGTGTATEELLPVLSNGTTHYTFTDVSGIFLKAAQKKFSQYPFIEYGVLDIEQSPQEQGYSSHGFDVIVAFNVLHVARNIGDTLERVRSLLAPGGFLLLWEITQARLEADIMDGVLMNPIADQDGNRNMGNPFLSPDQWQAELTDHGFKRVATFSEFTVFGEHIILAQTESSAALSASPALTPAVASGKQPDIADWFYIPSWQRTILTSVRMPTSQSECWLVFIDQCNLGVPIVQQLQSEGETVITVNVGNQFSCEEKSDPSYTINPQQQQDYNTLCQKLRHLNLTPKAIVHLWSVTCYKSSTTELGSFDQTQDLGFYSLLFLTQALSQQYGTDECQITVIANNMQSVTGEEILYPEKSTVLGLVKVIPQEYPHIKCRSIDIDLATPQPPEKLIKQLVKQLTHPTADQAIAYRHHHSWVQNFRPIRLQPQQKSGIKFRTGGIYLITGGLGNLGLTLAEYLAQQGNTKLILTGRSRLPEREQWAEWLSTHDTENRISRQIQKVLELEKLSAQVLVINADIANLEQMQAAILQAEAKFGQINGVIHAAGIPGQLSAIAQINKTDCEQQFHAKIRGLLVLEHLLQNKPLDFCILMSSLASVLGGRGLAAYSSANIFMDAFVSKQHQKASFPWISINWDTWQVGTDYSQSLFSDTSFTEFAFTAPEGINAFARIAACDELNQVLVSTGNLPGRITAVNQYHALSPRIGNKTTNLSLPRSRPNLKNPYIPPKNELECQLVESFENFLGFAQVGIHDNFFALGGDSLTGSILINQLRDKFQIELPVRSLFEAPTVAELAIVIEKILIDELNELSDEDANSMLQLDQSFVE